MLDAHESTTRANKKANSPQMKREVWCVVNVKNTIVVDCSRTVFIAAAAALAATSMHTRAGEEERADIRGRNSSSALYWMDSPAASAPQRETKNRVFSAVPLLLSGSKKKKSSNVAD